MKFKFRLLRPRRLLAVLLAIGALLAVGWMIGWTMGAKRQLVKETLGMEALPPGPGSAGGMAEARAPGMPGGMLPGMGPVMRTMPRVTLATMAASKPDRYLIRSASLTVETDDVKAAHEKVVGFVKEAKGYIATEKEAVDQFNNRSATIEFRVPLDKFEQVMKRVEQLGKVIERNVTAEDVTEEFVDVEARLRNLKRAEERLLTHFKRTGRLTDVVAVERELTRVREEIERLEGRLRFLAHRVEFSTIILTLKEFKPKALVPVKTFSSIKVASDAVRSLLSFGRQVWAILIWLGVWSPVWLFLGLGSWFVYRRVQAQP